MLLVIIEQAYAALYQGCTSGDLIAIKEDSETILTHNQQSSDLYIGSLKILI